MKLKRFLLLLLMIEIFVEIFCLAKYEVFAYGEDKTNTKNQDTEVILNEEEINVFEKINEYRLENGLPKLKYSKELQKVAEIKAKDLLESKNFSHTSETYGSTFNIMRDKKIEYKIAGENLAGNINSDKAVEAWINSEAHRDNILESQYNYTAIATIESPKYGMIFVQLFIG